MDMFTALHTFVRVVETGSFSAVARELGITQPTVSKQVAALETRTGAQLLRRTSRSMTLTEAGQGLYDAAVHLVEDMDAAISSAGRAQSLPSGLVRVALAPVFSRIYLLPRLGAFFSRYPEIELELLVTDRQVNLVEEGVDLCLHNGELTDSTLVVRKVAQTPVVTVATPEYLALRGEPRSPGDLKEHDCVIFAPRGVPKPWGFRDHGVHEPTGPFRSHDAELIRAAVLGHLGVAHTPAWLFAPELAAGSVCRILREYEPAQLPISIVHAAGRRMPAKVRTLIDFITDMFSTDPLLR
jgi:LysR family transcriptional regulator for bpeEF and oprC